MTLCSTSKGLEHVESEQGERAARSPVHTSAIPPIGSAGFGPAAILALQRTAGNRAVTTMLERQRTSRPIIARQTDLSAGSAIDPSFNPESIVHDLRRAIDQSDTKPVPKRSQSANPFASIEFDLARTVDAGLVIRVLDNRTTAEITHIDALYAAQEGGRSLENDLFGKGESGHPSDLNADQQARIRALLKGTRPTAASIGSEDGRPQASEGRLEADAVELHQLVGKDLDDEDVRERVMALHRRPVKEITAIDIQYEKLYGHGLLGDLVGELDGLQRTRLLMLRFGDSAKADALALEEKRLALDALAKEAADDPFAALKGREKRKKLIAGIEGIVEMNRREAMEDPANAGKTAAEAVQERLSKVLGAPSAEAGQTLGAALGKTLGPVEGGAIAAMLSGSVVEAAARRLVAMEASDTTSSEKLATLLREFRSQADRDVRTRAFDPSVPRSEKEALADRGRFEAAVDEQAKRYTSSFVETYDRIRGDARTYASIVASADDYNEDMLNALTVGGGRMSALDELDWAIRKKDEDAIKAVLSRQTRKEIEDLQAAYAHKRGRTLEEVLFGLGGTKYAGMIAKGFSGGLLGGRDAASAAESLDKPEQMGGDAEVEWILRHGQREVAVTEANSGAMGAMREWGDDPETQVLMNESGGRLKELAAEWQRNDPWTRPRHEILAEMRRVRATLTGDATAYEEENEQMVAELRSAVSFAVQVALALALPGVGAGFLATTALNIGATVASNMLIYGEQYSLTSFRDDVLGGALGVLGGKLGEGVVDAVAKQVAGGSARAAAAAAERAGLSTMLAKQATMLTREGANYVGSTIGTSIATGQDGFTLDGFAQNVLMTGVGKVGALAHPHAAGRPSAGEPAHLVAAAEFPPPGSPPRPPPGAPPPPPLPAASGGAPPDGAAKVAGPAHLHATSTASHSHSLGDTILDGHVPSGGADPIASTSPADGLPQPAPGSVQPSDGVPEPIHEEPSTQPWLDPEAPLVEESPPDGFEPTTREPPAKDSGPVPAQEEIDPERIGDVESDGVPEPIHEEPSTEPWPSPPTRPGGGEAHGSGSGGGEGHGGRDDGRRRPPPDMEARLKELVTSNMTERQRASATPKQGVVAAGELHVAGRHAPEQFVEHSGGAGDGAPDAIHVLRGDEVPVGQQPIREFDELTGEVKELQIDGVTQLIGEYKQLIREVIPSVPERRPRPGVDEAFPTAHDRHESRRRDYLAENRAAPHHTGSRSHDAERKVLDSASAQLAENPAAAGELHLMPSHPPCPACTAAIHAFRGDHPNVTVFLYDFKPRAPETPATLDGFFDDLYD